MNLGRSAVAGLAAALLVAAGWTAAVVIRDPAQTELPASESSLITAAVTSGRIDEAVTVPAVVTTTATTSLTLTAPDDRIPVVSAVPVATGTDVPWCSPLVVVSGRPVFALEGPVRAYRDLTPGDSGEDVRQLQEALRTCGLYSGRADGVFGPVTLAAVDRMYRAAGHTLDRIVQESSTLEPDPTGGDTSTADPSATGTGTGTMDPGATGTEAAASTSGSAGSAGSSTRAVPWLRARELAFLPSPGRILAGPSLGQEIGTDPLFTISHQGMSLRLDIPVTVRPVLAEGMAAEGILDDQPLQVVLPTLPDAPTMDEESGSERYQVSVPVPEVGPEHVGQSVTLEVRTGDEVVHPLVVPATAVQRRADGSAYLMRATDPAGLGTPAEDRATSSGDDGGGGVQVADIGVQTEEVKVTVVASGGGLVAVQVAPGAHLAVDDLVVLGTSS